MTRKTVFITGAAHRIGAAVARDLHAHGMDVVIHYRTSAGPARYLADSLNAERAGSAHLVRADLAGEVDYDAVIEEAAACTGNLHVLINNASQFYPTPVGGTTREQWRDIVDTNMQAPFFLSQASVPYLRETGGCIINMTDIYGNMPLRSYSVYSAAKAGLIMLTRALARELAPEIRVNGISPGSVMWPEGMDEASKKAILERVSLGRQGTTRDLAAGVRFLILEAEYMTGQVLNIDGGRTLY
jgi:pteridine reductase